ncbi:MAG: hypothetical protein IJO26_00585 [Clostridium sp.]|nr:hypothetical protein [Clostridium sp.]
MAGIKNSNFYVDLDVITSLINSFNSEIEKLTEVFLQVENEMKGLEYSDSWSGSSYESFRSKYEEWNLEYLQRLTEILQLKQYLEEVKAVTEELINQRNTLPNYLEV